MTIEVNHLAVIAAAIASMAIGFVWYGPLFGAKWMRLMGWDPNDKAKMQEMKKGMAKTYTLSFFVALLTVYVVAHFISLIGIDTVSAALQFGFWVWLGFVVTTLFIHNMYEGKSKVLLGINAGYHLIVLLIVAVIVTLWK